MADLMASVEASVIKQNLPELHTGDTVRVHAKVVEGTRERIQVFEGVVMRLRKGGAKADFTVRRLSHGVGVERTFLINSPRVDKVEVVRHGQVRRAQLYYLRGRVGRAARIRERRFVAKGAAGAVVPEVLDQTEVADTAQ
jgi:large subunit ribosomal protein L19